MYNPSRNRLGMRAILMLALTALLALSGALLVGCGGATDDPPATTPGADAGEGDRSKPIRIGWIPWDEDIAVTFLWKQLLEEEGYTVELTQLEAGPMFGGLAAGDLDVYMDAWLPVTHEDYWATHEADLERIGTWNANGLLTWAVPDYVDIASIEDLVGRDAEFDGRVIGIEPGAGLTRMSLDNVMPDYGLDDFTLVEGSTPAMLAELERATRAEEPIVVTLWRPHWAYAAFDMKDLEDPKGSLGEAEEMVVIARKGFSAEQPEVAGWLADFKLTDDQIADLAQVVISDHGAGQEEEAVRAWLSVAENRALADGWLGK